MQVADAELDFGRLADVGQDVAVCRTCGDVNVVVIRASRAYYVVDAAQPALARPLNDGAVSLIGAGVAGIYQIKRLADLGVNATVLEAHDDLGGTWYQNRYPGARFDSESFTYGYSFSRELLDEWHWSEQFSPQPETLRYLNHVVDKFDLRRHMQFGCRVRAMTFDDDANAWTFSGFSARFDGEMNV